MNKNYGGVIWTKHSLARMRDRGIKQGDAWVTWRRPDQSRKAKTRGMWVYYKTFGNQRIEIVAKQNKEKEWIILSVWSGPSLTKFKKVSTEKKSESLMHKILKRLF